MFGGRYCIVAYRHRLSLCLFQLCSPRLFVQQLSTSNSNSRHHKTRINHNRKCSSLLLRDDPKETIKMKKSINASTKISNDEDFVQISRTTTAPTTINDSNNNVTTAVTVPYDPEKEGTTILVDDLLRRTRSLMDSKDSLIGRNNNNNNSTKSAHHVIAFSGGIDSSVGLALIHRIVSSSSSSSLSSTVYDNESVTAVLGLSPAVPVDQRQLAECIADQIGVRLEQIPTTEGSDEVYVANDGRACFSCKTHLYTCLKSISDQYSSSSTTNHNNENYNNDNDNDNVILYNGTNADDLKDPTRLGLIAAEEFFVRSPLRYLSKDKVRLVGRYLGLPNWNYAASPCLRSRLASGVLATHDHLKNVELAERFVRTSLPQLDCTRNLRVRILSGNRAMIEVDNDDILNDIQNYLSIARNNDNDDCDVGNDVNSNTISSWRRYFERDLGFSSVGVRRFKTGSVATMPT